MTQRHNDLITKNAKVYPKLQFFILNQVKRQKHSTEQRICWAQRIKIAACKPDCLPRLSKKRCKVAQKRQNQIKISVSGQNISKTSKNTRTMQIKYML